MTPPPFSSPCARIPRTVTYATQRPSTPKPCASSRPVITPILPPKKTLQKLLFFAQKRKIKEGEKTSSSSEDKQKTPDTVTVTDRQTDGQTQTDRDGQDRPELFFFILFYSILFFPALPRWSPRPDRQTAPSPQGITKQEDEKTRRREASRTRWRRRDQTADDAACL